MTTEGSLASFFIGFGFALMLVVAVVTGVILGSERTCDRIIDALHISGQAVAETTVKSLTLCKEEK